MKIVISEKTGKTFQAEVEKAKENALYGLKIGESFEGGLVGVAGYKLEITGGSDKDGFPMRKDLPGQRRADVLLSSGPGFKPTEKGERARKKVRGNTVSDQTSQLNVKVTAEGEKKLEELFPKKEAAEKKK